MLCFFEMTFYFYLITYKVQGNIIKSGAEL